MIAGSIMMGFGTLSIAYFILYAVWVDLNNVFTYFWLLLGALLWVLGLLLFRVYHNGGRLPKWFAISAGTVSVLAVLFFGVMIGLIAREAHRQPTPGADYMIVLGARVKGDRLSSLLRYRLDKALDYLSNNPDTMVIVSGGQGPGEDLTEAAAMQAYLVQKGISADRILMEDTSMNTDQNIRNSIALIQKREKEEEGMQHLILLSNGFHLFRATRIMKKQLFDGQTAEEERKLSKDVKVEGMGAASKWYVLPNAYVREVFAVVKYALCGQI